MVYREGEFRNLCTECQERSDSRCVRCGDPLCDRHAPGDEFRCLSCEAHYLHRETSRVKTVVITFVVAGAILGFFGALAIHAARNGLIQGPGAQLVPLILFGALSLFVIGFAAAPVIRVLVRRRFLAERPSRLVKPED